MSDDRQTRLEEHIAHQQHLIDVLNAEVTEQRREMGQVVRVIEKLEDKVKLLAEFIERRGDDLPHEKPPHY